MTSRRDVLKTLSALAAAGLLPRAARGLPWNADSIEKLGVQLYTVRALMRSDMAGTLKGVAAVGYREVEFAGYFNRAPAEVRQMLDDNGLTSPSCHLALADVQQRFDATAAAAHTVGHRYLTVASLDARALRTPDDCKRTADAFNVIGEQAQRAGLRFAYHNHDVEFAPVEGQVPLEILLGGTDAALVAYEMDLYWTVRAGHDPLAWFARHPGRFEMVHVKDSAGAPGHAMTAVGAGTIDWTSIFAQHRQAGIRHYIVEHDAPADPMASIRASYDHLRALRF